MKKEKLQELAEQWHRATEEAAEAQDREHNMSEDELKVAAAFRVKTRLQTGRTEEVASAAPTPIRPCPPFRYSGE